MVFRQTECKIFHKYSQPSIPNPKRRVVRQKSSSYCSVNYFVSKWQRWPECSRESLVQKRKVKDKYRRHILSSFLFWRCTDISINNKWRRMMSLLDYCVINGCARCVFLMSRPTLDTFLSMKILPEQDSMQEKWIILFSTWLKNSIAKTLYRNKNGTRNINLSAFLYPLVPCLDIRIDNTWLKFNVRH